MGFVKDHESSSRTVDYKFIPTTHDAANKELRFWDFHDPNRTDWPIDSIRFYFERQNSRMAYRLVTIRIACYLGDGPDRKTRTHTVDLKVTGGTIPMWLAELASMAVQGG